MKTRYKGTFVISWSQTEIDGVQAADSVALTVGATWRWSGKVIRVDGPNSALLLNETEGPAGLRRRAASTVRSLIGAALTGTKALDLSTSDEAEPDHGFTVTDGRQTYTATIIKSPLSPIPLLMFLNDVPPCDTDLWVVRRVYDEEAQKGVSDIPGGVICFTKGTLLKTERGLCLVEALREGDRLQTKDNGFQSIMWVGSRRMSGARLYAMPELRPIRLRLGALWDGVPDRDLTVSPNHRILVEGRAAQALFNTPEVLVAARDLLNDHSICIAHHLSEVTYYHLLLEQHQVVWANGVQSESFHPANMSLQALEGDQRSKLFEALPELENGPNSYGAYARRNLSALEARVLRSESRDFPVFGH